MFCRTTFVVAVFLPGWRVNSVDRLLVIRQHGIDRIPRCPAFGAASLTEGPPMSKPRITYIDPATVTDEAMLAEFDRCRREGTPRPESQAIRAHVPAVFWSFANSWRDVF